MEKIILYIMCVFILFGFISCGKSTPRKRVDPPTDARIMYDPNFAHIAEYGLFLNEFWDDAEVRLLEKIPGGVLLPNYSSSTDSLGAFTSQDLLAKLLIKLINIEDQLDLYLQYKSDTFPPIHEFIQVEKPDENALRAFKFLTDHFNGRERGILNHLPYGLDGDIFTDKTILPKVLVKSVTIGDKMKLISSSPTINIDPKEFIRKYLKDHPDALK